MRSLPRRLNMSRLTAFWKNFDVYSDDIVGKTSIAKQDYEMLKSQQLLVTQRNWNSDSTLFTIDLPSEPFVGDLDAPIYIMTLNPGAGDDEYTNWKNTTLQDLAKNCVVQGKTDYPFYYLNPKLIGTGGYDYWRNNRFSGLIKALSEYYNSEDIAIKKIANNVCDLELCAYRSSKWDVSPKIASKLSVVKAMKDFIVNVVVPGVIRGEKTFLVGRGREYFKSERFNYNGKIITFDDLETEFPDRVVFYHGQACRSMSFNPYGYAPSGGGGTLGGQVLLESLKKLS